MVGLASGGVWWSEFGASIDVFPRLLSHEKHKGVHGAVERLHERRQEGDPHDGPAAGAVAKVHGVHHQRGDPQEHIRQRVDENQLHLALGDGAAGLEAGVGVVEADLMRDGADFVRDGAVAAGVARQLHIGKKNKREHFQVPFPEPVALPAAAQPPGHHAVLLGDMAVHAAVDDKNGHDDDVAGHPAQRQPAPNRLSRQVAPVGQRGVADGAGERQSRQEDREQNGQDVDVVSVRVQATFDGRAGVDLDIRAVYEERHMDGKAENGQVRALNGHGGEKPHHFAKRNVVVHRAFRNYPGGIHEKKQRLDEVVAHQEENQLVAEDKFFVAAEPPEKVQGNEPRNQRQRRRYN